MKNNKKKVAVIFHRINDGGGKLYTPVTGGAPGIRQCRRKESAEPLPDDPTKVNQGARLYCDVAVPSADR